MRERAVESYLCRRVKRAGGEVRKLAWLGRRHAPDRVVLWPGRHDLVELKRPGEKPRLGQRREHLRLMRYGFAVFVLDTKDAVDRYLEMRGYA